MRLAIALLVAHGAAFAPELVPRLPELTWSPATVDGARTDMWNAELPGERFYVVLGPLAAPVAEGLGTPAGRTPSPAELATLRRLQRFAASAARVRFSYGGAGGDARAWVWTADRAGPRVRFEGRAPWPRLRSLVAYAWEREVLPLCGERAPGEARRLAARWFR